MESYEMDLYQFKKMTGNRFNRVKQQSTTTTNSSPNHLTTTKAHQLFLDNDNIDMREKYIIKNLRPPIDMKDAFNEEYCENN